MDAATSLSSKILIISLHLLVMQHVLNVNAIKCFVCDSTNNPSCADLKSNSSIVAEECVPEKMRSIDSWLFELNELKYFPTSAHSNPLFNCQKVVAREPNRNRVVTARFCQLHTADSDACKILENKMKSFYRDREAEQQPSDSYPYNNYNGQGGGRRGYGDADRDRDRGGRRGKRSHNNRRDEVEDDKDNEQEDDEQEKLLHCSICSTDRCNAANSLWVSQSVKGLVVLLALLGSVLLRRQCGIAN